MRLNELAKANDAARAQGGLIGGAKRVGLAVAGAATFARLYFIPAKRNAIPGRVRLAPAW
jgi:magnesium-protoporphyrin IX monomethyl ester (oxidative) cyclase